MTQSKAIFDRWAPILNKNIDTKWDHKSSNVFDIDKYPAYHQGTGSFSDNMFPSILPMASRVAAQTIGMDLVSVVPMRLVTEEMKNEVKAINRERKIESIVEDKEFEEMKIKDHPQYSGPKGNLMYMDFKYGGTAI